jgi:hypothetical protein
VKRAAPFVAACALVTASTLLVTPRVTAQTPTQVPTPTAAPTASPTPSAPGTPTHKPTAAAGLRCTIVGLATNFPSAGSMTVTVDANNVGAFQFEPTGTQSLSFGCTPGDHTFAISASLAVGGTYDCDGTFTIEADKIDFFLRMSTTGNSATCRLTPV